MHKPSATPCQPGRAVIPPKPRSADPVRTKPVKRSKRAAAPKLNRAQKAEQIKDNLFDAAAKVVGEVGYLNAMVQMITARADLANGTFYNYFESRQEIFDQLLPRLGAEMLTFIASRSRDGETEIAREEQRFTSFFAFLSQRPEFYRILYEAEVFAHDAFVEHTDKVSEGYERILRRARASGALPGYDDDEIAVIALILMGARHYIAMRFINVDGATKALPDRVVSTYMKFVAGGLRALADPGDA
jgi:AcrR family transcriptional regulator